MFVFRDRIGIKPIYYYWNEGNFVFASELKSMIKLKEINENKSLNNAAISSFLHLGYIPEPHSIYKDIYKFPSGYYATVSANKLDFNLYLKIEDCFHSETITNPEIAKLQLK